MAQLNNLGELNLLKVFGRFSLVFLIISVSLSAGTFEDFKRTQFESFERYKDEKDNKFAKYLKSEWQVYFVKQSQGLYKKSKPKQIPLANPKRIKSAGPLISVKIKNIKLLKAKQKNKSKKTIQKDINFDFYGNKLGFNIPTGVLDAKFYPQNQKGIAGFFGNVAKSDYEYLVEDINRVCKTMNLNDWGIYLLVHKISESIFSNQDESDLLSWFIFNKLGFSVKVGLSDRHVVLVYYSKKVIYSTPNYTFGKKKFYALPKYTKNSFGKLYSYKQNYPDATKAFDLSLKSIPNFAQDMQTKTLSFKEFGKIYTIDFEYNQNLIDFMATYPQADYETFFNAPLGDKTYLDIATKLKKYTDGKKASDALNFVLHFVQKSFKYERDDEQFGREKVMFAEETLYYDKSDCEDRAVLFAYLVKNLFKIGVVGVKYKDHMATGLYIPTSGDSVKDGRKKFIIADPTYVNASIGQSMPRYRSIRPDKFIRLNKD